MNYTDTRFNQSYIFRNNLQEMRIQNAQSVFIDVDSQ